MTDCESDFYSIFFPSFSGVDVLALIQYLGFVDNEKLQGILSNSSTFLIAYAVHKLFAPVRISITLATTPFLVRYLRKVGILKMKKGQ